MKEGKENLPPGIVLISTDRIGKRILLETARQMAEESGVSEEEVLEEILKDRPELARWLKG
jgi:hypothetical protein